MNLILSVPDEVLTAANRRARAMSTDVAQLVGDYLGNFAGLAEDWAQLHQR